MDDEQIARVNELQRRRFDQLYERFLEPIRKDVIARMARIVEAASLVAGERVLDVGTGTGALIPLIQSYRPGAVIACDLSTRMLEQVARLFPDVERYNCDVRDLELPDESIDVVFMNGMFGNIADKGGALRNVRRMLRPSGRVIISHPEGRAFVARIARSEPFPITPLPTEDQARAMFDASGFTLNEYLDEEKLLLIVATASERCA